MFLRLFQMLACAQAGEAMVVAICRDKLPPAFNGKCGEKRIRHQVTFDFGGLAETAKDLPVAWPGIEKGAIGLVAQFLGEGHGFGHTAGWIEYVGMGDDPKRTAEDEIDQPTGMVGVSQFFKPVEILLMVE